MGAQLRKDGLWWPLVAALAGGLIAGADGAWLAGLTMLVGNALAGVIRNIWTFVVIFCGHFTDGVHLFPAEAVATEARGHWYLRQVLGSSNLKGGRLFHLMTGNLSHQIEHHLFPDLPARRYAEVAPAVREVCRRHGVPYNTGSLTGQFLSVVRRIVRHSFPGGQHLLSPLPGQPTRLPSRS
jgi:linoleoyl-CoA desaturase